MCFRGVCQSFVLVLSGFAKYETCTWSDLPLLSSALHSTQHLHRRTDLNAKDEAVLPGPGLRSPAQHDSMGWYVFLSPARACWASNNSRKQASGT